mmetsp:Transcript_20871/g.71803  ORF Transcript_20871/g.71803 Transcript_20871/m.71803 type:complete len:239 (+) Transcript_20871:549-1265(+)
MRQCSRLPLSNSGYTKVPAACATSTTACCASAASAPRRRTRPGRSATAPRVRSAGRSTTRLGASGGNAWAAGVSQSESSVAAARPASAAWPSRTMENGASGGGGGTNVDAAALSCGAAHGGSSYSGTARAEATPDAGPSSSDSSTTRRPARSIANVVRWSETAARRASSLAQAWAASAGEAQGEVATLYQSHSSSMTAVRCAQSRSYSTKRDWSATALSSDASSTSASPCRSCSDRAS